MTTDQIIAALDDIHDADGFVDQVRLVEVLRDRLAKEQFAALNAGGYTLASAQAEVMPIAKAQIFKAARPLKFIPLPWGLIISIIMQIIAAILARKPAMMSAFTNAGPAEIEPGIYAAVEAAK